MTATTSPPPCFLLPPATYGPIPMGPFLPPYPPQRGRTTTTRHRPSSASGAPDHTSTTMGANFKDRVPGLMRRTSKSKPRVPSPEATNQDTVEKLDGGCSPKLSGRFFSGSLRRAKKKRSIVDLFPSADCEVPHLVLDITATPPPTSPIIDHLPLVPPVENRKMSVVLEANAGAEDEERVDGFQRKNHFLIKSGMKHHPYTDEAPYMQAYDPILLDNDRFTESLLRRLNPNGSPTFHDYGTKPPSNVLDLGCGHGRWVVEAAATWKSFGTKVTGFDLVNVSGHSWAVGDEATLDNITWVQGNFLKYQLPFPDRSFDLVRMANLSLSIPHDEWLRVFSEVRRVLTPGGRLELIDDQIFFPYNEAPVPLPISTHHTKSSTASFDSDSDYDTDNTGASSTLVDHHHFFPENAPHVSPDWEAHATNSKGLETIFENMLSQKYGIHSRPQDIIDVMLSHVFGKKHADQIKVMHLALDPGGDQTEADRMAEMFDVEVFKMNRSPEKSEDEMEVSQVDKQTQDGSTTPERPTFEPYAISPKAASVLGISPTDQTGDENLPIQIPENVRTLSRLKISPSIVWRERWSGRVRDKHPSLENLRSEIPESVSLKVERLGVTQAKRQSWESKYSLLNEPISVDRNSPGERALVDDVSNPISPKTPGRFGASSSFGTVQSPGLILWPSTFIPVEPLELEMHACKNMHVLLGCKAALWDFIQDVKGDDGKAHISEDEFNELTWEYECFRRKRFNWPAEISRTRPSIPRSFVTPRSATMRPATSPGSESFFRRPKSSSGRSNSSAPLQNSTLTPVYKREDLTFVRVFRVYEAYRVDEQEDK